MAHDDRRLRSIVSSVLFCLAWTRSACPAAAAPSPGELVRASGVQGGLVVHVGSGDGARTAAFRADEKYLVHGLATDPRRVRQARTEIAALGYAGKVSVATFGGTALPYADNVVNLLVVEDTLRNAAREITRVLAPRGVAVVRERGNEDWLSRLPQAVSRLEDGYVTFTKPVPTAIDEWTHYLHGPDNNAVANDDVVDTPFHTQWVAEPAYARHHNHLSSLSAAVSARGRLFSVVDEGSVASVGLPPTWVLVARDAFSGVTLWKRGMGPWEGHLRTFRSGPLELARRLVAVGDRVYATLGLHQPVVALDAATGETMQTYKGTEDTQEILLADGILYLVTGHVDRAAYDAAHAVGRPSPAPRRKGLRALSAESGELLWERSDAVTAELMPSTLCVSGERVFFHNPDGVVCMSRTAGQLWTAARPLPRKRLTWAAPTLVVRDGVVLSADRTVTPGEPAGGTAPQVEWKVSSRPPKRGESGELIAFSAADGTRLWSCPSAQGYTAPPDVFVADGLVWTGHVPGYNTPTFTEGRDLHTGEVKRRIDTTGAYTQTHHHRCYRNKATNRFIVLGRTGVELIGLTGELMHRNCWVRGACQYGVLPCNGLLYAPPHACACYIQSKLNAYWALAPAGAGMSSEEARVREGGRLEHGPAWSASPRPAPSALPPTAPSSWPVHRHDVARTNRAEGSIPTALTTRWTTAVGGKLTAPVTADGVVCFAAVDAHTVHAVSAGAGERIWTFAAGGRIDSPPTLYSGRAFFGCADGWVYCLRLTDGELVWRYRIAPIDRRVVSFDQVESVWPVTGSVLVHKDTVFCTAGRSSFIDGGMLFVRLDARTGETRGEKRLYTRDPETGAQLEDQLMDTEQPGFLPDILVLNEHGIFLRDQRMDLTGQQLPMDVPHMYSSVGLLDGEWWHRTYWLFGTQTFGRYSGWHIMDDHVPSGRIMALDDATVFGYGRVKVGPRDMGLRDVPFHLYRADQKVTPVTPKKKVRNNNKALMARLRPSKTTYHWRRPVPMVVRAMVLAENALAVAGPAGDDAAALEEALHDPGAPSRLMLVGISDGQTITDVELPCPPVFDGLIAADGRLYMSTLNGSVVCLGAE